MGGALGGSERKSEGFGEEGRGRRIKVGEEREEARLSFGSRLGASRTRGSANLPASVRYPTVRQVDVPVQCPIRSVLLTEGDLV